MASGISDLSQSAALMMGISANHREESKGWVWIRIWVEGRSPFFKNLTPMAIVRHNLILSIFDSDQVQTQYAVSLKSAIIHAAACTVVQEERYELRNY